VATDPTEKFRQWTGALFLGGLAVADLVAIVVEVIFRHGTDPGVDSIIVVIATIVLAGPVGIKIVRDRGTGGTP
jgi:hypothetical protein